MGKLLTWESSLGPKVSLDNSHLGQLCYWTKSYGQRSPWTITPWIIVAILIKQATSYTLAYTVAIYFNPDIAVWSR